MQVIADRIGRQEVLLLIYHNRYNFSKKKLHFGQKSPVDQVFKVSNSYILEVP